LGRAVQGRLQLPALVQHLGHANVHYARERHGAADLVGDLQRLLVGAQRRAQMAEGALHLAQVVRRPHGQVALTGRPLLGDYAGQAVLGLHHPAALPVGHGQMPVDRRAQCPVILSQVGEGLLPERVDVFGVPSEPGQVGAFEGDGRWDVREQARAPAHRRLRGCVDHSPSTCQRAFGRIEQLLDSFHAAAEERQQRLRQQQPGPGGDQVVG
jgi:hypothetical protein